MNRGMFAAISRWSARSALLLSVALFVVNGAAVAQEAGAGGDRYEQLSDRNKALADMLTSNDGLVYNSLDVSQQATFEAIMHALDKTGLDSIVERVTAVWGVAFQERQPTLRSIDGREQFRISVILTHDAVAQLLGYRRFKFDDDGHVLLPSGRFGGAADSAREPGPPPNLQVSWLEDDLTVGEIDIDYRSIRTELWGHGAPENSDVRECFSNVPHYERHVAKYGRDLEKWWKDKC